MGPGGSGQDDPEKKFEEVPEGPAGGSRQMSLSPSGTFFFISTQA